MDFDDIYELLESVRMYRLRTKEELIPLLSTQGEKLGYVTANSEFPSASWGMPTKQAKASASARGTKEGKRIEGLLATHVGRKQLLEELRAGTLEYGIPAKPYSPFDRVPFQKVSPEDLEYLRQIPAPIKTPKQCLIPGL